MFAYRSHGARENEPMETGVLKLVLEHEMFLRQNPYPGDATCTNIMLYWKPQPKLTPIAACMGQHPRSTEILYKPAILEDRA